MLEINISYINNNYVAFHYCELMKLYTVGNELKISTHSYSFLLPHSDASEESSQPTTAAEDSNGDHYNNMTMTESPPGDQVTSSGEEAQVERKLSNDPPPPAERTLSGDTIVSVTSDSAGLIPA